MNESVIAMIDKLHARLDDLAEVIKEVPFELAGYDKRLDRIDDQVYLIEVELEKKLDSAIPLKPIDEGSSERMEQAASDASSVKIESRSEDVVHITNDPSAAQQGSAAKQADESEERFGGADSCDDVTDGDDEEGFLTDSAKETIAGATKRLNAIYREGKDVVGEFSEAFGDIKDVFGKNPFKRR